MAAGLKRGSAGVKAVAVMVPPLGLDVALLFDTYPGPLLHVAPDGTLLRANEAAEALGQALRADLDGLWTMVVQVAGDGCPQHRRLNFPGNGAVLDLTLLALAPPQPGVLVLARDVTPERDLTQALVASRQMLRDLVACSADFAFETLADGRFGFVSPRGALGFRAHELAGRPAHMLAADGDSDSFLPLVTREKVEALAVPLKRRDGSIGQFEISAVPVFDSEGNYAGARGICRDVTEARARAAELNQAHRALQQIARTDELTGLLNRRAFLDELPRRLAHLARHGRAGALLYIDLDNFKAVNDDAGHAEGDALLRAFSRQTEQRCRTGDLLARFGGDEFAIWLEEVDAAGALSCAHRLHHGIAELEARFGVPGAPLGLSIGIVLTGGSGDAASLLRRADEAMYQAKRTGKGGTVVAGAADAALPALNPAGGAEGKGRRK